MRDSVVFYKSFRDAISKLSPEERLKAYEAIFDYAFDEVETEEGVASAILLMAKPQIDANNQRYENGKKGAEYGKLGGRPAKEKPQDNPKETPKEPQENPKVTPNVNVNVNENVNVNDKKKRVRFTPPTLEEVEAYCKERNSPVNPKDFFEYFDTGHWIDSKGDPVRNWKQKLITWEKHAKGKPPDRPPDKPKGHFATERQYDFEAIERQFVKGAV